MSNPIRVLAAVDKSESAMDLAEYITNLLEPGQAEVTLYHVRKKSPWKSWSLKKDSSQMDQVISSFESWDNKETREAENMLDRVREVFLQKGFVADAVTKKIDSGADSVAQSILKEAENGYQAVALGRSGESAVKDLILGTTASKLLGKLSDVPMWVVGKTLAPPNKAIIAIDDGEASMQAVEHVALVLAGVDAEVILMHIVENRQSFNTVVNGYLPDGFEENWISEVEKVMSAVMDKASDILQKAGIKADSIKRVMLRDEPSRAGGMVEYAEREGVGTIVVGRSNMTAVEGILLGRVSNKLVQMAKNSTVWVVN